MYFDDEYVLSVVTTEVLADNRFDFLELEIVCQDIIHFE
jgi:hypothetical protein